MYNTEFQKCAEFKDKQCAASETVDGDDEGGDERALTEEFLIELLAESPVREHFRRHQAELQVYIISCVNSILQSSNLNYFTSILLVIISIFYASVDSPTDQNQCILIVMKAQLILHNSFSN